MITIAFGILCKLVTSSGGAMSNAGGLVVMCVFMDFFLAAGLLVVLGIKAGVH